VRAVRAGTAAGARDCESALQAYRVSRTFCEDDYLPCHPPSMKMARAVRATPCSVAMACEARTHTAARQGLLDTPQALFALVLSPTRELAIQIAEQFEALGAGVGVRTARLVGGIDMMAQAIALGRRPHVLVGTPGRVVDHLSNTKARLGLY